MRPDTLGRLAAAAGLLGVLLLALATKGCAAVPLGIANRNPGNICARDWRAWRGGCGRDPWGHLRFADDEDGLRAIRWELEVAGCCYGIHSIVLLAHKWVREPHGHAQVAAFRGYLLGVAQFSGFRPWQRLDLGDPRTDERLAHGIVRAENGEDPYPEALYREVFRR